MNQSFYMNEWNDAHFGFVFGDYYIVSIDVAFADAPRGCDVKIYVHTPCYRVYLSLNQTHTHIQHAILNQAVAVVVVIAVSH